MGAAVSSSHIVPATPSYSGEWLLTLFSCSSEGSLPWIQSFMNFSSMDPSLELSCSFSKNAPSWDLSMGCNLSGINWRGPHRITGPAWNLLQQGLSTGCSFLEIFHLFQHRLICSMVTCSRCTSTDCRGISALVPEVPPLPPHSLICGSLTYHHFSPGAAAQHFLSFLKYFHRGAPNVADWLRFNQWQISLTDWWNWLSMTWGQPLASSHRSHPFNPSSVKPFHINLMQTAARVSHDNKQYRKWWRYGSIFLY